MVFVYNAVNGACVQPSAARRGKPGEEDRCQRIRDQRAVRERGRRSVGAPEEAVLVAAQRQQGTTRQGAQLQQAG